MKKSQLFSFSSFLKSLGLIVCLVLVSTATFAQDGVNDPAFNVGTGANYQVFTTAIQSDGKIIIGGLFTYYNGTSRNYIARLNADGTLDETFAVGSGTNGHVYAIAIQGDGKIIIGGDFTSYNGTTISHIARLNADGTLDGTFTVGTGLAGLADNVGELILQNDGKIIIGGYFSYYNEIARKNIARLNADGTLDESFTVGTGANGGVKTIAFQSDGKFFIGGDFTSYNGISRSRIALLNTDGTLDQAFPLGTGANSMIQTIAIQTDGNIVIGGLFSTYNGVSRKSITRILGSNSNSLTQTAENEVMVYPNPTNGRTNFDLGEFCQSANVEVFDICGKLVMQKQYNNTQILDIDITAPVGVYFVTVTTANKRETLKLIKN